jgi:hypothetical protein
MALTYFLLGSFAALLAYSAVLGGLYFHFTRTREKQGNIKGYLDLIPDLTREQREKVQDIRRTFLPKVDGIRLNLCRWRAELAQSLFSEPSDRSIIFKIEEQILKNQAELEHEIIEHILEEKDLLSSPQRAKFYSIIVEQFASGSLGIHDVRGKR